MLWGLMQERIMTKPYETGELFRSSKFLVFANRFLALVVAWAAYKVMARGDPKIARTCGRAWRSVAHEAAHHSELRAVVKAISTRMAITVHARVHPYGLEHAQQVHMHTRIRAHAHAHAARASSWVLELRYF